MNAEFRNDSAIQNPQSKIKRASSTDWLKRLELESVSPGVSVRRVPLQIGADTTTNTQTLRPRRRTAG
jgi:hypothetical protein